MNKLPELDMYEFIDDGIHRSFYTILGSYLPELNGDFSTSNLINGITTLKVTSGQELPYKKAYQKDVEKMIKLMLSKVDGPELFETSTNGRMSDEEFKRIFDELKASTQDNPDCKFFVTIKEYLDYATKHMDNPDTKPLRDAIVTNAMPYAEPEDVYNLRTNLLNTIYVLQAQDRLRGIDTKNRQPGRYPAWDELEFIRRTFRRNDGIRDYDTYYERATERISEAVRKVMERESTAVRCEQKRFDYVNDQIRQSVPSGIAEIPKKTPVAPLLFDKLKRKPEKTENSWELHSYAKPELICDLMADYSENGQENQRVIAFRYGKFKYKKPDEFTYFNIDYTAEMPELVGISRLGKDGANTYFVLMPPLQRLTFKPEGEVSTDPGDKPYVFTATEKVEVPLFAGKTVDAYEERPVELVDHATGGKLNAYMNNNIPTNMEEFYAKVYFSDEYLRKAISGNARYIGNVVDTDSGLKINTSDIGKTDIAAAHYAIQYPGTVDGRKVISFEKYCTSGELDVKQYHLIQELERDNAKNTKRTQASEPNGSNPKKDEDAR